MLRPNPPRLTASIRWTLCALRRRIRAYVWLQGCSAVVVYLGVAFWLSLGLDRMWEPPQEARIALLVAALAGLAAVGYRAILRRVFVRLSDRSMATLLERRFPEFDDGLLTAVELIGRDAVECHPDMLARTCRQAAEPIHEIRLGDVFDGRPLRRALAVALLLAVSVGTLAALRPHVAGVWARRTLMLRDEPWPRKTRLVIDGFAGGTAKVARGAEFEVTAKADLEMPLVPRTVRVRYRSGDAGWLTATMSREGEADPGVDRYQRYVHTFHGVVEPIALEIHGGDDVLRGLKVRVVDVPTLTEVRLHCRFPDYMERAQRTIPAVGVTPIPRGTEVTFEAAANKPLVEVRIDTGEKTQKIKPARREKLDALADSAHRLHHRTLSGQPPEALLAAMEELAGEVAAFGRQVGQDAAGGAAGERIGRAAEKIRAAAARLGTTHRGAALAGLSEAVRQMEVAAAGLEEPPAGDPPREVGPEYPSLWAAAVARAKQSIDRIDADAAGRGEAATLLAQAIDRLNEAGDELTPLLGFHSFRYKLLPLTEDKSLSIELLDVDGIGNREPIRLTLAATPDQAPVLAVRLEGIGTAITPQARLPVRGRVTDDYGVAEVWFEYTVEGQPSGRRMIAAPAGQATDIPLDDALDAGELDLQPGQKILVTLKAADRCDLAGEPNLGSSDRWVLDVVTPDELRTMLEAREIGLRQRFEAIIQGVEADRQMLAKLQFEAPWPQPPPSGVAGEPGDRPTGPASATPRQQRARLALRLGRALQDSRKAAHETQAVAEAFDQIRAELINNRIYTEELRIRIEDHIVRPLGRVDEEMFPRLGGRLKGLQEALASAERAGENRAGPARAETLRQYDAILAALRDVLGRMVALEDFNEAIELLRSIIAGQDDLRQQIHRRQKEKLRELLED